MGEIKHCKMEEIPVSHRCEHPGYEYFRRKFVPFGGAKNRSLDDSLNHFDAKLLLLYDLLNTEEAKRIALPRHQFLQAFYTQFKAETK